MTAYSDRICGPEQTWSRIEALLPRFGVTRLSRLTGLDRIGIPVWNAVSPNARSIVINQGKGIADIDAKVSAAMEALERAVAGEPLVVETSLSGDEQGVHNYPAPSITIPVGQSTAVLCVQTNDDGIVEDVRELCLDIIDSDRLTAYGEN